ncbi:MAG: DnaJ domain-containing protein [Pseudomonadota bacterium]
MAFLIRYGKKLIEKMIRESLNRPGHSEPLAGICMNCGRRAFHGDLRDGICGICRADERQRESGRSNERVRPPDSTDDLQEAYRILNCSKSDSDDHIKQRYRILVKECHVDSLPKGLPDYLVQAANQKFRQTQESYKTIMKSRNEAHHTDQ